jgi:hypothetical protein
MATRLRGECPETNRRKHRRMYCSRGDESTFRSVISGRAYQYDVAFFHQTLVMKGTLWPAPVAKLVVVINDDPLVLEATGGLLRSWGCCVITAKSCDEALICLAETEAGACGLLKYVRHLQNTMPSRAWRKRFERGRMA